MTKNVIDPSWQGAEATEAASCEQLPARFAHGTDQHRCHGAGSKARRVLLHTRPEAPGCKGVESEPVSPVKILYVRLQVINR